LRIIKKINNGAAIGIDSKGREIVVLGKGIGFPEVPYELDDLSKIKRTFYDIDSQYLGLLSEISSEIFMLSTKVVERAKLKIECELNPNLVFTLADHISFAIERYQKGIDIGIFYSFGLEIEYPLVFEVADYAISLIRKECGVIMPDEEKNSIALHLINARMGNISDDESAVQKVLKGITDIVEAQFKTTLDKKSFNYYRFANHIRRFVQRKSQNKENNSNESDLFQYLTKDHPGIYICVRSVDDFMEYHFGTRCTKEELAYLMIHINVLTSEERKR